MGLLIVNNCQVWGFYIQLHKHFTGFCICTDSCHVSVSVSPGLLCLSPPSEWHRPRWHLQESRNSRANGFVPGVSKTSKLGLKQDEKQRQWVQTWLSFIFIWLQKEQKEKREQTSHISPHLHHIIHPSSVAVQIPIFPSP